MDIENACYMGTVMGIGGFKMPLDEPFYHCPKYQGCSVNACPLDTKYPRYTDEKDSEKKRKLPVKNRVEMSAKFPGI